MPVNAVAVLHAGRQVVRNGSGVNSRSSSANGGGSGVSRVAAISTTPSTAGATAGGGSAAEILLELRALREAMSAGAGAFVGQVSASRVASRVASRGTSREASVSASRGASLEPLPVGGTGALRGVRRSISPPFAPSKMISNAATAPGTIDGLSRELRRTTDAYFALVKLTTSERAAAVEREKTLNTDLTHARASAEAAAARAARRDPSPAATRGASASAAATGVGVSVAPTTIIHTQHQQQQQQQQQQQYDNVAAAAALDDTRTRIATLSARAFGAEDRVAALTTEREALLDFVQVRREENT